jgi:hypothetical protein
MITEYECSRLAAAIEARHTRDYRQQVVENWICRKRVYAVKDAVVT